MKKYIIPVTTITETQASQIIATSLGIYGEEVTEQGAKAQSFAYDDIWGSDLEEEE